MSLTKKMPKNRTSANNSHGDVDAEAADADARLELVDAAAAAADARLELVDAAAAADARLELVDAAAAAVADRLPLAANRYSDHCRLSCDELRRDALGDVYFRSAGIMTLSPTMRGRWVRRFLIIACLCL